MGLLLGHGCMITHGPWRERKTFCNAFPFSFFFFFFFFFFNFLLSSHLSKANKFGWWGKYGSFGFLIEANRNPGFNLKPITNPWGCKLPAEKIYQKSQCVNFGQLPVDWGRCYSSLSSFSVPLPLLCFFFLYINIMFWEGCIILGKLDFFLFIYFSE